MPRTKFLGAFIFLITLTPLSSPAAQPDSSAFDGIWRGSMICGDKNSDVAFKTSRKAIVKSGRISLRRGTPNKNRFEAWEGTIHPSGTAMIFGRYTWKTEKPLWFKGKVTGRKLAAIGRRGPKICELSLVRNRQNKKGKTQ